MKKHTLRALAAALMTMVFTITSCGEIESFEDFEKEDIYSYRRLQNDLDFDFNLKVTNVYNKDNQTYIHTKMWEDGYVLSFTLYDTNYDYYTCEDDETGETYNCTGLGYYKDGQYFQYRINEKHSFEDDEERFFIFEQLPEETSIININFGDYAVYGLQIK